MLTPGWIFLIGAVVLALLTWLWRWPLPIVLVVLAILAAFLAGFGVPFRHLIEGGFGYLNLVMALFAGAFFGQMMQKSGIAEAFSAAMLSALRGNAWAVLALSGVLLFSVGMFVGIAGVAVLATGVLVVPMLRGIGMPGDRIGAFVAVVATCGMIAPPVNVPAMTIADGVNMPYIGFAVPLLCLSVPPALYMIIMGALRARRAVRPETKTAIAWDGRATTGLICIAAILIFWTLLRLFPGIIPDPAVPLVLVLGGLAALPALGRRGLGKALTDAFSGVPLVLAAVLVTVGVMVQIMTLTGIRGWLVINSMSFPPPWAFVEMALIPVFGGVLTSIGAANILGVPFAFALIHQDMILNVSGLSAVAALSEFVPPTAIAAALATYVVGDTRMLAVVRASAGAALLIAVLAIGMLVFADALSGPLVSGFIANRAH